MAGKFIELKEAAAQLGITPERLQELREAGKIHGYKDGASWKFKPTEVERLVGELSSQISAGDDLDLSGSASFSGDDFDQLLNLDAADGADDELENSSILISEEPAKDSEHDSSSTVIGKEDAEPDKDSDLKLVDNASHKGGAAKKALPESAAKKDAAKKDEDDYELKLADSEDLSDELALSDNLDFESDEALVLDEDSDLGLADDHLVLGDSGSSEDGALEVGSDDSGIGVANPSDSGLSLEENAALELPEDEDMISLEDELDSSPDDSTQLQQDEEFLLSPSDEMLGDESSDSGSQVIALDDSGAFESDSDAVALDSAEPMLVPDEPEGLDVQLEPIDGAVAVAGAIPMAMTEASETAYTVWNILALLLVVLLLSVTGMLMADVVRNMWAWNGDASTTSGLANSIVDALGMK